MSTGQLQTHEVVLHGRELPLRQSPIPARRRWAALGRAGRRAPAGGGRAARARAAVGAKLRGVRHGELRAPTAPGLRARSRSGLAQSMLPIDGLPRLRGQSPGPPSYAGSCNSRRPLDVALVANGGRVPTAEPRCAQTELFRHCHLQGASGGQIRDVFGAVDRGAATALVLAHELPKLHALLFEAELLQLVARQTPPRSRGGVAVPLRASRTTRGHAELPARIGARPARPFGGADVVQWRHSGLRSGGRPGLQRGLQA
mmetsp:Transcript_115753/g.227036  ORF Transcript_115753/g.227036 Transcript_115753/m.227036 type:complete len:258 (+) Transcript_115753:381-1154(+)